MKESFSVENQQEGKEVKMGRFKHALSALFISGLSLAAIGCEDGPQAAAPETQPKAQDVDQKLQGNRRGMDIVQDRIDFGAEHAKDGHFGRLFIDVINKAFLFSERQDDGSIGYSEDGLTYYRIDQTDVDLISSKIKPEFEKLWGLSVYSQDYEDTVARIQEVIKKEVLSRPTINKSERQTPKSPKTPAKSADSRLA